MMNDGKLSNKHREGGGGGGIKKNGPMEHHLTLPQRGKGV